MTLTKKIFSILGVMIMTTTLFCQNIVKGTKAPFTKGVNLSKWFELWSPGLPNLNKYNKSDFENLKNLGCDVIRVPIHFAMLLDHNGNIKKQVFDKLDQACDWAEELQIYLIIDNHSFNSSPYPKASEVAASLKQVWPQILERYKNRSNYIIFEILNEPQIKNSEWEPIQKETLELIRSIDKKHTVVVTGAEWSGINAMCNLKPLDDSNLIYTFHFYDPYVFTHQGASWAEKAVQDLKNIPFPYDKDRMPPLKESAKKSWVGDNLKYGYSYDATENALSLKLNMAMNYSQKNNVPVWCGEMGVYDLVAQKEDRNNWYKITGKLLQEKNIPFTVWGYEDSFGIFLPKSAKRYPKDLNVPVLQALGMKVPNGVDEF